MHPMKTPDSPAQTRILDILLKSLDLNASDPRDKIFALLLLGKETQKTELWPIELRSDYYKSTAPVYADFSRWWILTHKSLHILSSVQISSSRTWQTLSCLPPPTRVKEQASCSLWHDGNSNWAKEILGLSTGVSYSAAMNTSPDAGPVVHTRNSLILPLAGRRITTIQHIMPYPYYKPAADHQGLHGAHVAIFDLINEHGKWTRKLYSQPSTTPLIKRNPSEVVEKERDHRRAHADYTAATDAIKCHSGDFFRSAEGVAGLCPASAHKSDLVIVLDGRPVPYLLRVQRRSTNATNAPFQYELIGEYYLHGYMDRRAVREQRGQNRPSEVFELV